MGGVGGGVGWGGEGGYLAQLSGCGWREGVTRMSVWANVADAAEWLRMAKGVTRMSVWANVADAAEWVRMAKGGDADECLGECGRRS